MSPGQELEFEQVSRNKTEEEAWWSLFQLLIPGMRSRDMASLANEYSPCEYAPTLSLLGITDNATIDYINYHISWMVPAMSFPAIQYQPVQAPQPSVGSLASER